MKAKKLKSVFVAAALLICMKSNAQFTFGVSPGMQLNGASFGYKMKNVVPFFGLQVLGLNLSNQNKGKRYDAGTTSVVAFDEKVNVSVSLIMPTIGAKYFFKTSNKLKAYGLLSLSKGFLRGKAEVTNSPTINDQLQDILKNTKVSGGQIGFGTEYFFDNNFSVGGEFGFRFISIKRDNVRQQDVYNSNTMVTTSETFTTNTKVAARPTYVKICLNFYFP